MNGLGQVGWEMFQVDEPNNDANDIGKERCTCGGKNCRTAKHIKCVCRCHSQFHGIEQRRDMQPLDGVLGLERPGLLDLAFDRVVRAFAVKDVVLTSLSETEGLVWEGEITPSLVRELSENLVADAIENYIYFEAAK